MILETLDVRPTVYPEALGKGEGIPTCTEALTGLSGPALGSEGGFEWKQKAGVSSPLRSNGQRFPANVAETQRSAVS